MGESVLADGATHQVEWCAQLSALLGERFSMAAAVRAHHGRGEDYLPLMPPDAVAFPVSTDEVAAIVRICAAAQIPMIPFGAGSSLEGHVQAQRGGLCLDLTRMNQILSVSADDMDCRVQAGVTRIQLNEYLRDQGLFFPLDPGANATLGGMAATRASGTNAVRYGTMRDVVLGLTAVTADGQVITTGGRARKSAAGYDLTRLLIGSEGTLAVITELQLRLFGIPEAISAAVIAFDSVDGAVCTVMQAIQLGLPMARVELMDALAMRACIAYSRLEGYEAVPTLFVEFHGSPAGVAEQAESFRALADDNGGGAYRWADKPEDRSVLWKARHDAYFACKALAPGKRVLTTDVCVPISRLADCIAQTGLDLETVGLVAPILGHVGDGNFHCTVLVDPENADELSRAHAFSGRLVDRALSMGGTCTGEHGIGMGKKAYLIKEHGAAVGLMQAIKGALDPHGLMNPGKVLDMA
jgi:D-lactate dehydrogenase (cytochrome)